MTNGRLSAWIAGEPGQREVRDILGPEMRRAGLRATGGHHRGETEDGDDGVRLPDGDGLHPEYGFREATEQHQQRPIMSRHFIGRVPPFRRNRTVD